MSDHPHAPQANDPATEDTVTDARPLIDDPAVRQPSDTDGPTIVVGVDADPASLGAVRCAADLAVRTKAWLVVVHVSDLRDTPVDPEGPHWEDTVSAAHRQLADTVRAALRHHPGGWSFELHRGDPAGALSGVARDRHVLLIVLGHHGGHLTNALKHLVDGSTGASLLARQSIPVVLVPAAQA